MSRFEADTYLDQVFEEALKRRASDVHFEPHGDGCHVMLRVDGLLGPHEVFSLENLPRVVARLKVLAGLPVYERDMAFEGHVEIQNGEVPIQARLSILPTIHGEKAVVRIFRRDECALSLDQLGLGANVLADLRVVARARQGVLLFTGPSGSGKTTTIYALLEELHRESRGQTNIATLEDPVERDLGFAAQTPLSRCRNMTFADAFKSLLRQDPEVIVVGEIRDPETAQIAVRAGMTGHLVISTIHSRDTCEAFPRLLEMGVEAYLAASAVVGVVSQRLVRKLCGYSKTQIQVPEGIRAKLGVEASASLYGPSGCRQCANTGYFGRTALAESLTVGDDLREAILSRADLRTLRRVGSGSLSVSLAQSAARLLAEGVTSPDEIFRVLPRLENGDA
ncbi:MAG: type II/IV secretion system protein [Candidatus Omnitrophica bacterium]|nr:type II/IV secretion system protein [Candidatus Omnitrophota bacterium]